MGPFDEFVSGKNIPLVFASGMFEETSGST
jgi:hypothetical protein